MVYKSTYIEEKALETPRAVKTFWYCNIYLLSHRICSKFPKT